MKGKRYEYRTEQILVRKSHPMYTALDELAFKAKNVENSATYMQRQHYFKHGWFMSYATLEAKYKVEYASDYYALQAQTSQQLLMKVTTNCKSYTRALKDFKANPSKYKGRPNIPGYKHKVKGRSTVYFTNQQLKFKDNTIPFPEDTKITGIITRLKLKPSLDEFFNTEDTDFNQLRIVKNNNSYTIEIVYSKLIGPQVVPSTDLTVMGTKPVNPSKTKKPSRLKLIIPEETKELDLKYVAGLDIGIDNFATIATYGPYIRPLIINGKGLKSYNKDFNKQLAHFKSLAMKRNDRFNTEMILNLYDKRNRHFMDFYHKASKTVIDYLVSNKVKVLVIGYNKGWKQRCPMSKRVNQTFIQIGYRVFIDLLIYKARNYGIEIKLTEESYTSGTSFLDDEKPTKSNYNKNRREYRGLFLSNKGIPINADVNAAYQILRKVYPAALYSKCILKIDISPIKVTINKSPINKSPINKSPINKAHKRKSIGA